jgi:hypothetical protein
MKSIQSILTIILTVFLIGMMPNLADAATKTITISPDKLVPTTGADNYNRSPAYVSSANGFTVGYWAKIKFPNNVNRLKQLIYYHQGFSLAGTAMVIYRSRVGVSGLEIIGSVVTNDDSGDIIKIQKNIPGEPKVDESWTYWIFFQIDANSVYVYGAKIKVSTR